MHGECCAPRSVTIINDISVAASQFHTEPFTLGAGLSVTLANFPASGGFFVVFLDKVLQDPSNYTVNYLLGTVTMVAAAVGQQLIVIYIAA
jgi:hypothetical protein